MTLSRVLLSFTIALTAIVVFILLPSSKATAIAGEGQILGWKDFRPAQAPNYPFIMPSAPQGTIFEVPNFPADQTFIKTSSQSTIYCSLFADVIPHSKAPVGMALNVDLLQGDLGYPHPRWIQNLVGDGTHVISYYFGGWMLKGAPADVYRVYVQMYSTDSNGQSNAPSGSPQDNSAEFRDQVGKVTCFESLLPAAQLNIIVP